jgi:hypothetical protein
VIVRLTSAVIVGGIHRNAGEEVKVDSALGDSLVRRQLAEPIASKPAQASSPAPQPTLDLDPPARSAPLAPAPDPVLTVDPVLSDETDETEQETEPSEDAEPRESETESPGEPSVVPEGETSSSPSRKRRRR